MKSVHLRRRALVAAAVPFTLAGVVLPAASSAHATPAAEPQPTCTTPDSAVTWPELHCYTPQQIRAAYGVDQLPQDGAGQTIVLVDAYGSPTATHDIDTFASAYRDTLGATAPNFDEVYPLGMPDYSHAPAKGNGLSGPASAAGWAGEATLDIEWADAIAPKAHIVLLATPPAETEGVQGLPNMMKAIQWAIDEYPAGTVFSMSFGTDEPTFGPSAASQFAKFDQTFINGLRKGDTFFSSAGDSGSTAVTKQHKESGTYSAPATSYPNSSPYVTSVGGTQLQYGWTWDPQGSTPYIPNLPFPQNLDPHYFNSDAGGNTEAVWNESWISAAGGGGASSVYPVPSWQQAQATALGETHRMVPDLSWNAAVNGGVLCYETYPAAWTGLAGSPGWQPVGGTSASSPQVAALTALANQARAEAKEGPVGYLNPLLYTGQGLGNNGYASGAFRDIVEQKYGDVATVPTGDLKDNTDWTFAADGSVIPGPIPGYPTLTGYDMATGWGTPKAPGYVSALVQTPAVPAP